MTICGALTEPIASEISRMAQRAVDLTRPTPAYDDVIAMCIEPEDIPVLKRAWMLIGQPRSTQHIGVRFRDVGEGLDQFKLDFRIDAAAVDMLIPSYAEGRLPARGSIEAQQRIMPSILRTYHLACRMRAALEAFNRINECWSGDFSMHHMRYHLDWLPGIMRKITPSLINQYENTGRTKSERDRRARYKEQKDLAMYWSSRLTETSDRYNWSVPHDLRPLIAEASAAMATYAVLERSVEYVRSNVECTFDVPYYLTAGVKLTSENSMFPLR